MGIQVYRGIFVLLVVIAVISIIVTSLIPFTKEENL